jgi:sugar phosphate isomerase/epimerase
MSRTISLAPLTVLELAPAEMVTCAAQAGYRYLGLRLNQVLANHPLTHRIIGEEQVQREILKRLDDTGLKVLDIEFIRLAPETRVADFVPMLETGARLGAKHVLTGGNDPDPARLAERFAELCDAAAPLGLTINIEPIPVLDVRTLAQAVQVLENAGRPNAGIVIDPIHFDRSLETYENLAQVPRQWLHYMQFCDAPAERPDVKGIMFQARYERMVPGEGGLDLLGLLRALPRDLPIALEVPMTELSRTVGAVERAKRLRTATEKLLQKLDSDPRQR